MKNLSCFCLLFFFFSCVNTTEQVDNQCMPGTILVVYLGESSKPTNSLLLRTNEGDTTYMNFVGGGKEKFDKYGFDVTKEAVRNFKASNETFNVFKKYIIEHRTDKNFNFHNANQNSIKILLSDRCDFIMYSIDENEKGYFSNLVDILGGEIEPELRNSLSYYEQIVVWDGSKN
jgi:hypothetical protein